MIKYIVSLLFNAIDKVSKTLTSFERLEVTIVKNQTTRLLEKKRIRYLYVDNDNV